MGDLIFLFSCRNSRCFQFLITAMSTVVKPDIKISLLHDGPDNRIIECARASNADLIVTGDKHLLILKELEGIGITRVAGFLYIFETRDSSVN